MHCDLAKVLGLKFIEKNLVREVLVLLGSNIQKEDSIAKTLDFLNEKFDVQAISHVYEFPAVEEDGSISDIKPSFLNCVVRLRTLLTLAELHKEFRDYELGMGRLRSSDKFAPRIIDIDVLIYEGRVLDKDSMALPYVSIPLSEVLPL